jgi:transposase
MTRATATYAARVGIDWADRKHDLCLQAAGSERRERLVLEHRPEAIDAWACALRVRFGGQPVAICLEQHKGPLMAALAKYDHLVLYPINPLLVATRRRGLKPIGAKSDTADAELILDLLIEQGAKLRSWHPDDVRTRQLQALVEARRTLVESRVRTTNALTANLKLYFPQALECFDDLASALACDFLTHWPSLGQAQRVREVTLTTFFHAHGVRGDDLIAKRCAMLRAAMPLTSDSGILIPALLRTKTLIAVLRAQRDGISEYDAAITKAFEAHPDAAVFASFPGAGPTFAPRLLAAFGSDRERFTSARAIQEYTGVAPVTEASGQSHWVHWRWACPRFVRQSLVEWAGMSIRYSFWAKTYYQELRERGKAHNAAVRALAFKWLRIVFRCWQDRKPYDEAKYLLSLRERHSPLLQAAAKPLGQPA